MTQKALIFDSGTLINLSMNGLLYILEELKKTFHGKFLITSQVKYETLDRPLKIDRFEFGALRIQSLLDSKVLEMPSSIDISESIISEKTQELMTLANHTIQKNGKWIPIVSEAEMSCLALSSILNEQGFENIIAIDERTTRMLSEKPQNLEEIMSRKLHQKVHLVEENFSMFSQFKFIRSSEIAYVAYKKNLLKIKGKKALEAVLFATKFKGCSISYDEVNALKKMN